MVATLCSTTDVYRISGLNSDVVSAEYCTNFIEESEDEIKNLCHKWWGGTATITEYFNRRKSLWNRSWPREVGYVYTDTSDDPFHKDYVLLTWRPVRSIQRVYILNKDAKDLNQVWSDDGGAFTDNTTDANSVGGTAFDAFAAVPVAGDILYIGSSTIWENTTILLATAGVDGGTTTLAYEYWNGAAWTAISSVVDNTSLLTQDGTITFEAPRDWAQTIVNGSANLYYMRIRITNADYVTAPTISQIYMNDIITDELNVRDISVYPTGKIQFMDKSFEGGIRDLKIKYTYGASAVPFVIRDFCASLAALRCLIVLIGGSYDDVTNYSIPEFSASKGEPYTNLRATIVELEKKIYGWTGGERGNWNPGLIGIVGIDIGFSVTGDDNSNYSDGV